MYIAHIFMKRGYFIMKFKQSILPYIAGVSTAAILFGTAVPTMAASVLKDISVIMGGISVYVDGELQSMKDVNGNTVEAMIYDGTTYLPVRAVTGMLSDKDVNWDADTQSVYIGTQPQAGAVQLEDISIISENSTVYQDLSFDLLDETIFYTNALYSGVATRTELYDSLMGGTTYTHYFHQGKSYDFRLDSAYSEINGSFAVLYDTLGDQATDTIYFYSVDQYGAATLIKSYDAKAGDDVLNLSVPLYGVNILRITVGNASFDSTVGKSSEGFSATVDSQSVFYNVSLNPVQ